MAANACRFTGTRAHRTCSVSVSGMHPAHPLPVQYRVRIVLMQCSDLLMVGKKTLNIGIIFGCGGCRCNAGISMEKDLDERRKVYFIGGDRTDRRYWTDDLPTDRVHPVIELVRSDVEVVWRCLAWSRRLSWPSIRSQSNGSAPTTGIPS